MIDRDEKMLSQIEEVIAYSQGLKFNDVHFRENYDLWRKNKYHIYSDLFNGELIKDFGEININPINCDEEIKSLITFIKVNVGIALLDEGIFKFLEDNNAGFMDNKVVYSQHPSINVGMKLSKAFKYFIPAELLDCVQTHYSMLIQKHKITGHFYMSIHPLDYLSSSENNNSWRSCHALNGEYRSGNIQYMCDASTIVCYIASPDQTPISRFPSSIPWNSKKWRMLLFTNKEFNFLLNGRQYPMDLGYSVLKLVLVRFNELLCKNGYDEWRGLFSEWKKNYLDMFDGTPLDTHYLLIKNTLRPITSMIKTPSSELFYNDLLYSHYYNPYYAVRDFSRNIPPIEVGVDVYCCECGNILYHSDKMICDSCGCYETCGDCGDLYPESDMIYLEPYGYSVCPDCLANSYSECSECGEYYSNSEIYYDDETDRYYCESCYNNLLDERERSKQEN